MSTASPLFRNKIITVLLTGLIAGAMDISAASLQYYFKTGKGPSDVLHFVASGVFGKEAFTGGDSMNCWGLLFHFMIAMIFAIIYFNIYPLMKAWFKNIFVIAIIYGIVTWAIMNRVVLPLSHAPAITFHLDKALIAAGILIICIGLPVAGMAEKYYLYKKS